MKLLPSSSYFLPSHKEFSGLNRCSAAFLGYLKQLDWDYPTEILALPISSFLPSTAVGLGIKHLS